MPATRDFVHLHVHTDLSLLQSALKLKPLAERLGEFGMNACAITDYANMFGAISFYNTMKSNEIKPILGYEAFLSFEDISEKGSSISAGQRPYYNLVLLAKDLEGYLNLCYMASKAYTDGFQGKPLIDLTLLSEKSAGLIGLSGGINGVVSHFLSQGDENAALKNAKCIEDVLGSGNFFLEIQDHGIAQEKTIRKPLVNLSKNSGIPLVATNDVHYLNEDDARAHEVLMCIGDGKTINDGTRRRLGSDKFYLRSAEEMWEVFGTELPEALTQTVEISEMCDVEIKMKDNLQLPVYPVPEDSGCKDVDEFFEKVIWDGFDERKREVWDVWSERGELKYPIEEYKARIQQEIEIINKMGFPGYFLIVWDFMLYARDRGIPVGPGRGSAAGSLVAYCMKITDVDPIQYDLLFERFLNPERISMPDIDIDFCVRGRGEVIEHVSRFYGAESVCQIITFGTMASKASIKDVGRALNMQFADVEKIAKMIPPPVRGRNVSIGQALEQVAELREAIKSNPQVEELVDLAKRLEGCSRHTSVHAAGVVIAPRPLYELVPIAVSTRTEDITSQFPMNDLEKVGLLKMDFLALTTLTIISDCLNSLKQRTGKEVDWSTVSLTDEKTMALFAEGRTEAIFQFESSGMQEICRRLKPKELEDLAALNALYRPGPLDGGMVDDFIARHRGEKRVKYIVPEMKEILENTYGILVYQEQIMQLAQKLAGYSLGEADMMRRAMGKKKRSEMAVHETKFIEGAVKTGIARKKAEEIYNLMAQFADYGFNRSHSVAYAYVAFQTGYLKAHFPSYFYAAVLSSEADDTAKIYKYTTEMKSSGVKLLPPDVNESDAGFTPGQDAVRFGLTAIKGLGSSSVEAIIDARNEGGNFTSLFDFVSRVDQKSLNRRTLESLINAGAFDSTDPDQSKHHALNWRARLGKAVPKALSYAQRAWNDRNMGQTGLFAETSEENTSDNGMLPEADSFTRAELSQLEKEAVGFYLSSHPLDTYESVLSNMRILELGEQAEVPAGTQITAAGIVASSQIRHSRKGNRFAIFRLEDKSNGAKCLLWSEAFNQYSSLVKDDELLIVKAKVESNEGQDMTLIVNEITSLTDLVYKSARKLTLSIGDCERLDRNALGDMFEVLGRTSGNCGVVFKMSIESEGLDLDVEAPPLRIAGSLALEQNLIEMGLHPEWEFGV
ncbi:MAG: DNA polymerase III subunit alpha [Pyrinomonadaceae bacterium]|nr:DNA polymerase III subunit alpha [Pyrinomonadaceae bacterium]